MDKTKDSSVKSVDFINVYILVLILYYNFAGCYLCGKLGKVYTKSIIFYNGMCS